MTSTTLTIFHNPNCSTSRKALALLRDKGLDPKVVEYLKIGWTRETLLNLLKQMHAEPQAILRRREGLVKELGLDDPATSAGALLDAMVAHPVLVERPIVSNGKAAVVCRPMERLEAMLARS